MKRLFISLFALALLLTPPPLKAHDYTYTGGDGYCEYRTCANLAPGIALAVVALAAIIAVGLQNTECTHGHCHN